MGRTGMTGNAGIVQPLDIHVDIKFLVRRQQGGIKITVLDTVTTATLEMTGSAGSFAGWSHMPGNIFQVNGFKNFCSEFFFFIRGMATGSGKFFIGSRGIMTDKTVNIFL